MWEEQCGSVTLTEFVLTLCLCLCVGACSKTVHLWWCVQTWNESDLITADACNAVFGDVNTTDKTDEIIQNAHPFNPKNERMTSMLSLYLPASGREGRGEVGFTSWPSCFILSSSSRWTSGDAPLPAHPLPETTGFPWRPAPPAVHRFLRWPDDGAVVASQRPRRDHPGGSGCLRGGNPASRLLPADQVHTHNTQRRWEREGGWWSKRGLMGGECELRGD